MSTAPKSASPGSGFYLGLAVVVALMGGVAVWQDRVSGRALSNEQMERAAKAIELLPDTFGDWKTQPLTMSEEEIRQTGTKSYYNRTISRRRGGAVGSLMLMCGQTRELSVHPPTVCFEGVGLVLDGEARAVRLPADVLGGEEGSLMAARFKPGPGVAKLPLFVYWGWSRDGRHWEAPDVPRLSFVGSPFLYKLYVIRDDLGRVSSEQGELCDQILKDFLPEFHASIDRLAAEPSVSMSP
jgi:hypothetical protein